MTISAKDHLQMLTARQTGSLFNRLYWVDCLSCQSMRERLLTQSIDPGNFALLLHSIYLSFLDFPEASLLLDETQPITPEEVKATVDEASNYLAKSYKGNFPQQAYPLHTYIVSYTVLCDTEPAGSERLVWNTLLQTDLIRPRMRTLLQDCPQFDSDLFSEKILNHDEEEIIPF